MSDEDPPFRVIKGGGDGRNKESLGWQLRDLTANLMRVAAGAGRAYDIERQVFDLADTFRTTLAAEELGLAIESRRLEEWLSADDSRRFRSIGSEQDHIRWAADGSAARVRAINRIIQGALRMAASRIRRDATQEGRAEDELVQGIRELQDASERCLTHGQAKPPAQPRRLAKKRTGAPTDELSEAMLHGLDFFNDPQRNAPAAIGMNTVAALARRRLIAPGNGPFAHVITELGRKVRAQGHQSKRK